MARRCESLGKTLRSVLSRGILKLQIDAADRRIASSAQENRNLSPQQHWGTLFQKLDGFLGGLTPATSLGTVGIRASSHKFASRRFEVVHPVYRDSTAIFRSGINRIGLSVREISYISVSPAARDPSFIASVGRGALASKTGHYAVSERDYSQQVRSAEKPFSVWTRQASQEKSQSMLMYLLAMVVGVVGVTYASVPLYRRFCQATGYGGTVQRRETVEEKIARHGTDDTPVARELVVHFNADVADSMPWKFTPCQNQVKTKVGQSTLAFYTAENTSSDEITGVSTYNVAPMQAGAYFNKIQCFCFEEQRLRPGERIDMPVLFYIDPEFATDSKMDSINSLILSYTFFRVDDEDD